ncbi:VP1 [Gokushovirus WZ-2015a]|nr:VP1 [Gokushovirus WZ-2015a]
MKSVMNHRFSQIPKAQIQRSVFDRSHGYKTTFNEGYLVPFYVDEVLPGDTVNLRASLFGRLATPIVPIMDNMFLETFWFYVPNRLVWNNWERMNGAQDNPGDSIDFTVPQVKTTDGFAIQSIFDYMGLPTGVGNLSINCLPLRAYNLIWNEWFRDENLQDSVTVEKGDTDTETNYKLLKRGKRHDYFTSALPWPQKGEGVEVPLSATIVGDDETAMSFGMSAIPLSGKGYAGQTTLSSGNKSFSPGEDVLTARQDNNYSALRYSWSGNKTYADIAEHLQLGNATQSPLTINSLRQAFQIQKLLERDARGGTRYTEILRSHFGVISPDARLQRPEYLGGSSTRININPVEQTSSSNDTTPQGNLAAFGTLSDSFHGFTKSFVEHGILIGLVNVRADLTYQQGLNRMWSRKTRYDYYFPVLAHLGEQTILNKEIYAQGNEEDEKVFGYQERYAEYRYFPSMITGKFRSTDPQSLDVWHLSQKFENLPVLNDEFIEDNPPISRVVAVQDEPHFLLDCYFKCLHARPMPVYSVPGLVDHF